MMPVKTILPLGCILHRVEKGPVVVGPSYRACLLDLIGQNLTVAQVFDAQRVLAEASCVSGIGEQVAVIAHHEGAESKKFLTFGELVEVENDLLRRIQAAVFAAPSRVLFPLLGSAVVEVTIP